MKKLLVIAAALAAATGSAFAADGLALAQSKNCLACHQVDTKLVGPAYKDVAAKFSAKDIPMLAGKIQNGSQGTWGEVAMPPNTNVSPEEAKTLATWIVGLKGGAKAPAKKKS